MPDFRCPLKQLMTFWTLEILKFNIHQTLEI